MIKEGREKSDSLGGHCEEQNNICLKRGVHTSRHRVGTRHVSTRSVVMTQSPISSIHTSHFCHDQVKKVEYENYVEKEYMGHISLFKFFRDIFIRVLKQL